ncbi:MAG: hypothetical protein RLZZ142_226 [Verrucomicrobiota bacterium]
MESEGGTGGALTSEHRNEAENVKRVAGFSADKGSVAGVSGAAKSLRTLCTSAPKFLWGFTICVILNRGTRGES